MKSPKNGQIEDAPAGLALLPEPSAQDLIEDAPSGLTLLSVADAPNFPVTLRLPPRLLAEYISLGRQIDALQAARVNLMSGFVWGAGVELERFVYTLDHASGRIAVSPVVAELGAS